MRFKLSIAALFLTFAMVSNVIASGFMPVANVVKIQGKALNNKEMIKVGDEIAEGMEVNIPKKGDYIDVKFQNGHLVRFVGANVKVVTLNPKNTLFNLLKGKIFSAIKPLTQDETFNVKTKRASFAVRGTEFMIEETMKQSYLCVCEGVVMAKSIKGEVEVKKDEDFSLAHEKNELKATLSAKSMIVMTKKVFADMGIK